VNFPDPPLDEDNSRTLFTDEFVKNVLSSIPIYADLYISSG